MSDDTPPLPTRAAEMFCFGLYTASHGVGRAYMPHLARLGLTYPQYIVLVLLWEENGLKVTDLAGRMQLGTNTVTPLIKRLETMGHVTRLKGDKDGRAVHVHLTASGWAMKDKAPDITACIIGDTGMSLDDLRTLQTLLTRLRAGLSGSDT